MVIVVTLVGLMTTLALPRIGDWRDRQAVRRAADQASSFYHAARYGAVLRGSPVRIELLPESLVAVYEGAQDSLFLRREGPSADRVVMTSSRSVIRILPSGIGAGGSNTTLVFRRGIYAESLTTSRLGRIKRWR
jgi:Tfp pilus assembly protein FimT